MLVGYVDKVERHLASSQRDVVVQGRDKTEDLVDASPDPEGRRTWTDNNILQIIRDIAQPFGIKTTVFSRRIDLGGANVRLGEDAKRPFPLFELHDGESAWQAIENAARQRGVLVYSPGDGSVLVTRPGRTRASVALVEGENLKSASKSSSSEDRFSIYIVRGQGPGSDDASYLTVAASPAGSAVDETMNRLRPLVMVSEKPCSIETATLRAQWEATVRAAQAEKSTVVVPGWTWKGLAEPDSPLWRQNQLVEVRAPSIDVDEEMLIASVTYDRGAGSSEGRTTTIELVRRDAFTPKPVIEEDAEFAAGDDGAEVPEDS
jgi:prophage tail gpP-like protein